MEGHYCEQGRTMAMSVQPLQTVLSLSNYYLMMIFLEQISITNLNS